VLWVGRLKPGETVRVPDAPFAHIYVAKGAVDLERAGRLGTGDAARLTAAGNPVLTADATEGAEVLIWEMDPSR
jgi:redox-sensitive bicupin YhaK (pirin superfamily)